MCGEGRGIRGSNGKDVDAEGTSLRVEVVNAKEERVMLGLREGNSKLRRGYR